MNVHQVRTGQGSRRKMAALALGMALLFFLSACAFDTNGSPGTADRGELPFVIRPQNDKYLRQDEWVRMLTLAINNSDKRDMIWQAIPTSQRSEISQADFIRYVSFLASCLPGNITSFMAASPQESEEIQNHAAKADKQLVPRPDQAAIWWIRARTSDLRELKFAVPLTLDQEGIPYFSKSWLQKQASLYDYVVLYLEALALQSKPALVALLSHNQVIRNPAQEKAIDRRAHDLLDFYQKQVSSVKNSYRCVEMMPGYAAIEEQTNPTDSGASRSRRVVFTEADGVVRAEERIPQELAIEDTSLVLDDKSLFTPSLDGAVLISSKSTLGLLGIPLSLEAIEDETAREDDFRVTWPGLLVEAVGQWDRETMTFEGRVRQLSISYSRFETGSGLKPGDSIYELYLRYPFARESGYQISLSEGGRRKTLAVQVESDAIARLTLIFDS